MKLLVTARILFRRTVGKTVCTSTSKAVSKSNGKLRVLTDFLWMTGILNLVKYNTLLNKTSWTISEALFPVVLSPYRGSSSKHWIVVKTDRLLLSTSTRGFTFQWCCYLMLFFQSTTDSSNSCKFLRNKLRHIILNLTDLLQCHNYFTPTRFYAHQLVFFYKKCGRLWNNIIL